MTKGAPHCAEPLLLCAQQPSHRMAGNTGAATCGCWSPIMSAVVVPFPASKAAPTLNPAELAEAEADLASALEVISRARAEYATVGGRTGTADIAEIRAGRFLANHGEVVLKALVAARRPMDR